MRQLMTEKPVMATKSFFEDMVIDTPEAVARLTELFEEDKPYLITVPVPKDADGEFIRRFMEGAGSE